MDGKPTGTTVQIETLQGCPWDIKIDLAKFWAEARRILRNDHSPVIHFCTTKFGAELIASKPDWFRYDLVWDKQRGVSFLLANKMPMRSHEMIYVFSKKGAYYNRVDVTGDFGPSQGGGKGSICYNLVNKKVPKTTVPTAGSRCALSIISVTSFAKGGKHPTEKPSELYRWLIERYCPEGGTVLDPTCGSGNSVFTALDMDRHGIGMEMDDSFFQKLVARSKSLGEDVIELVD